MPELSGRPLIIGGTSSRGVVTSASAEALKYGVKISMPTKLALRRCPDATILKGDFELFSQYSDIVNEIISEKAPVHERASIDEFYLDMSGMDKFYGSFKFTKDLVHNVKKETGLNVSFGLSINKTVAKMCSSFARPESRLYIPDKEVQPFLDPQSIRNIPSLGSASYKFLRRIRIRLIKTLRQMPVDAMQELMGSNGIQLWKKANGIDSTPVIPYSENKSLSTEHTFDRDTQDMTELHSKLLSMIESLTFKLRKSNMLCSVITVKIRYTNRDTETIQKKVAYTSNDDRLIDVANLLFRRLYTRRMLIRMIGVRLSGFVSGNQQIDLFHDDLKMIRLYQAMDRLRNRFDDPSLVRRANGMTVVN